MDWLIFISLSAVPPEGGSTWWYDRLQPVLHRLTAVVRGSTIGFSLSAIPPDGGGTGTIGVSLSRDRLTAAVRL